MSGAFSVPFAAAAVFSDQKYGPLIWGALAYGALLFMGFLQFKRIEALREHIRPKLSCGEIAVKEMQGHFYCRVSIQNDSSANLSNLVAYIDAIVADDPLKQVAQIDTPISLFTQERFQDRIQGCQPVWPFNLRGNQKKWIEIFSVSEPSAWQAHLYLSSRRVDFIAIPGMIFKCGVYGAGDIHFSIVYSEENEGHWTVKLIKSDSSELEIKGYPQ